MHPKNWGTCTPKMCASPGSGHSLASQAEKWNRQKKWREMTSGSSRGRETEIIYTTISSGRMAAAGRRGGGMSNIRDNYASSCTRAARPGLVLQPAWVYIVEREDSYSRVFSPQMANISSIDTTCTWLLRKLTKSLCYWKRRSLSRGKCCLRNVFFSRKFGQQRV